MQIYIFSTEHKEGDFTINQVYAKDFYIAWDLMIDFSSNDDDNIELLGIEFTTMPLDYCDYTELILNN